MNNSRFQQFGDNVSNYGYAGVWPVSENVKVVPMGASGIPISDIYEEIVHPNKVHSNRPVPVGDHSYPIPVPIPVMTPGTCDITKDIINNDEEKKLENLNERTNGNINKSKSRYTSSNIKERSNIIQKPAVPLIETQAKKQVVTSTRPSNKIISKRTSVQNVTASNNGGARISSDQKPLSVPRQNSQTNKKSESTNIKNSTSKLRSDSKLSILNNNRGKNNGISTNLITSKHKDNMSTSDLKSKQGTKLNKSVEKIYKPPKKVQQDDKYYPDRYIEYNIPKYITQDSVDYPTVPYPVHFQQNKGSINQPYSYVVPDMPPNLVKKSVLQDTKLNNLNKGSFTYNQIPPSIKSATKIITEPTSILDKKVIETKELPKKLPSFGYNSQNSLDSLRNYSITAPNSSNLFNKITSSCYPKNMPAPLQINNNLSNPCYQTYSNHQNFGNLNSINNGLYESTKSCFDPMKTLLYCSGTEVNTPHNNISRRQTNFATPEDIFKPMVYETIVYPPGYFEYKKQMQDIKSNYIQENSDLSCYKCYQDPIIQDYDVNKQPITHQECNNICNLSEYAANPHKDGQKSDEPQIFVKTIGTMDHKNRIRPRTLC
ncbi:hypothetical protein cand_021020 [Cryptosporidium andersoni]|uniref:Uncharacterized protein n=1 Tax=Cryptosporidium andersoni TaxID=117008 RepID=A0A1J4MSF6_9CRYT|nr:hypothetical protein cand_021020 [Cryptosporidium andersoni]